MKEIPAQCEALVGEEMIMCLDIRDFSVSNSYHIVWDLGKEDRNDSVPE